MELAVAEDVWEREVEVGCESVPREVFEVFEVLDTGPEYVGVFSVREYFVFVKSVIHTYMIGYLL